MSDQMPPKPDGGIDILKLLEDTAQQYTTTPPPPASATRPEPSAPPPPPPVPAHMVPRPQPQAQAITRPMFNDPIRPDHSVSPIQVGPSAQQMPTQSYTAAYNRDRALQPGLFTTHRAALAVVVFGSLVMGAGAFLPWLVASSGRFSASVNGMGQVTGFISKDSTRVGDGIFVLGIAAVVIVVALFNFDRVSSRTAFGLVIFCVLAGGIVILELYSINSHIQELSDDFDADYAIGFGLYFCFAGAGISFLASLVMADQTRKIKDRLTWRQGR